MNTKLAGVRWLLMTMESSSSLSHWDYLVMLVFRPILAILFVFSLISIGWIVAWKLVLVHVPLVQEIFGLRKKPTRPKPLTRRISRIYNTIDARNTISGRGCNGKGTKNLFRSWIPTEKSSFKRIHN